MFDSKPRLMKRIIVFILLLFSATGYAAHIKGGFFTYEYLGPGTGGSHRYNITLTVYMQCNPNSGQVSDPINFTFFDSEDHSQQFQRQVRKTSEYNLAKVRDEECLSGDQRGCYYTIVVYKLEDTELPNRPSGYTVSYQRCCRIAGVSNISNSGEVGNTYSIRIPGTNVAPTAPRNSSPMFLVNDTVVVCANSYFEYPFQATDSDGDLLSYEFCSAWVGGGPGSGGSGGTGQNGPSPDPASPPPYNTVPYSFPYSSSQPLGTEVTINPTTGLISGVAPPLTGQGEYVVTVCVTESRNGVILGQYRKELHLKVGACQPIKPRLEPRYVTCDGLTLTFQNFNTNPDIRTLYWDFGDGQFSSDRTPTHTYLNPGNYTLKVIANRGELCADSIEVPVGVWPGFFPAFNTAGICITNPVTFTDASTTNYGVVDYWRWNFGDATTLADTSRLRNSSWQYADIGAKTVQLIVGNSMGCIDTIVRVVNIIDKPPITLAFKDTLICIPDPIQLQASGTGQFSWSTNTGTFATNTPTTTVAPTTTTMYYVELNEQGCINNDSLQVRVVAEVSLAAMADTVICRTDNVQLRVTSDGLRYNWTPTATIADPTLQNPFARPTDPTTTYTVVATIGTCSATDRINVTTIPYPIANAGNDTIICYNEAAYLHGSHDGNRFTWSPTASLLNSGSLNPVAYPPRTMEYVLSSWDDLGCPKPGRDTVLVTVLPKIIPYAGNDTAVVVNQPLQLLATGGSSYVWSPATGLNNPNIADPIGRYPASIDSVRYKVLVYNEIGCYDSTSVKVTVFKTNPYVFVPTGFTPNGDGLNDVLKPIAVGVREIKYFRVFNRWGQLVFATQVNGHGWDGRINGTLQATNVYVWMVDAIDYTGQKIFLKGTSTLIR